MYSNIEQKEKFDNFNISASLTFFSEAYPNKITRQIFKQTGLTIPYIKNIPESKTNTAHLTHAFNEGYNLFKLSTGNLKYERSLYTIMGFFHVIEALGYTTDHCQVSLNLKSDSINRSLNTFMLSKNINESKQISEWSRWGAAKLYPMRTQYFHPSRVFETKGSYSIYQNWDNQFMSSPTSKKFGLDFSNISNNILGVNYIGGINYEKKPKAVSETINKIIDEVLILKDKTFESGNIISAYDVFRNHRDSLITYESFRKNYPGITLYFDRKCDPEDLRQKYSTVRESLFKLINYGGIRSGIVNYDSDYSRLQVQNVTIKQGYNLKDIDIVESKVSGDLTNCRLSRCQLTTSNLEKCRFYESNYISKSYLYECEFGGNNNQLIKSYIENNKETIHGDLSECLFFGKISYSSIVNGQPVLVNK